jgi:hypothetical protein
MSIRGVKFITRAAAVLAIFDKKPRDPAADTENQSATDADRPTQPAERLPLRLYPNRRFTMTVGALASA